MGLGMGLTVSIVGVVTVLFQNKITAKSQKILKGIGVFGAVLLILVGLILISA